MPIFSSNKGSESRASDQQLVALYDPDSPAAEDFRSLRTNLLYSLVDSPPKIIAVTSPGPREGKSTTCANFGVVLAQAGMRTLLLDCDLRKPVVHQIFDLRNMRGLVDVLAGQQKFEAVRQEAISGLDVLTVGTIPPNPAELLGSQKFSELLESCSESYDYVLIDSPPLGPVSDPLILASKGDGVLLVLDEQNTSKRAVRDGMRNLNGVSAKVLGTVMNNIKERSGSGYYGDYKYHSYTYQYR